MPYIMQSRQAHMHGKAVYAVQDAETGCGRQKALAREKAGGLEGMRMTTKEWLNRGRMIEVQIRELEKEKLWALERATGVTAGPRGVKTAKDNGVAYIPVNVQTSPGNSSEDQMVRYADYAFQIARMQEQLVQVKSEIAEAVSRVEDNTMRTLLFLRYIRFLSWERIAEEMGMSARWVRTRMHSRALTEAEKLRGD